MRKEDFVKLGIDEETAKKLETASLEELKSFIPKARFDEVNTAKNTAEALVKERDGQLETLKNSTGDVESLKNQIATLQADNKAKDEAHAAEIKRLQREAVDNELLATAKAKNSKAALALLEAIEDTVDIEGYRTKRSEQITALQKSADYLFEPKETKQKMKGAEVGESSDGDPGITKEKFNKMSYKDRMNLYNENKELYDSLTKE
ncbi:MAG: phage scaffolding protein [Clostridia bacterium]|nr:phage scaffolding protein [Clostridia bacterium]